MDDINLGFDNDSKKINMEGESDSSTAINLQKDSSDTMLGVELLTNGKGKSPELSVSSEIGGGGYSSGEESTKKEDKNFFNNDEIDISNIDLDNLDIGGVTPPQEPPIKKTVPIDDPMINTQKATDNGGF